MSADDVPGGDSEKQAGPVDPWKPIDAPPIDEPDGPVYFPLSGEAPRHAAGQPQPGGLPATPPQPSFVSANAPLPGGPVFVKPRTAELRAAEDATLADPDFDGRPWAWWVGPVAVVFALIGIGIVSIPFLILAVKLKSGHPTIDDVTNDYEHWFGLGQDAFWILVALLTPFLVARYLRPGQLGLRVPPRRWRAVGVFFASFVAFYALAFLYSTIFDLGQHSNSLLDTDSGFGDSVVRDVAFALLYTVAAPVAEELLFRGLLFRTIRDGFRKRTGRAAPWLAALISGVIFGGIHYSGAAANQNNYLPVLMALGVLLALAYNFSGTIYVNILLHSINNAIATGSNTHPTHGWVFVLIGVGPLIAMALVFVLSRFVGRAFPSEPGNSARPPSAEPAIV